MFIFNTTFSVATAVTDTWKKWMTRTYLPSFDGLVPLAKNEVYEVLTATQEDTVNYACQWHCASPEELETVRKYSQILLSNLSAEFGENCLYFSSILQKTNLH